MSLNEILIVVAIVVGAFCLIFFFIERSVRNEIENDRLRRLREEKYNAQLDPHRRRRAIKNYPVKELTQKGFNLIPNAESLKEGFLKICMIGFWFVCKKSDIAPDVTVIGQVVKGDDLFCDQYGAGLSVPERGINRYQVRIVEVAEETRTVAKTNQQ